MNDSQPSDQSIHDAEHTGADSVKRQWRERFELIAIISFLTINLLGPFVIGEVFPITISPMFRDQPQFYCDYRVTDHEGDEQPLHRFKLHRVYDGNPPGLGVGRVPRETLNRMSYRATLVEIETAVMTALNEHPEIEYVIVEQSVFAQVGNSIGQVEETARWKFGREGLIQ